MTSDDLGNEKRRRSGKRAKRLPEGSVRQNPVSKRWSARLPGSLSRPGGRDPVPGGSWATREEAVEALKMHIARVRTGIVKTPTGAPGTPVRRVRHAVEDYIRERTDSERAPLSVHTIRGYRADLRNHINNPKANIGNKDVRALTALDVYEWIESMARAGTKPGTSDAAKRLLSAALNKEVAKGVISRNPVKDARKESSKQGIADAQTPDVVLIPTWSEFAILVCWPERQEDCLLIALMGWTGLRFSEAVALDVDCVWRDRPTLTIGRVLTKRTAREAEESRDGKRWRQEPPKGGRTESIPIPKPLWRALLRLADRRAGEASLPEPAGRPLFRPDGVKLEAEGSIGIWTNKIFSKKVWYPARAAAGLVGDPSLPEDNPRRNALKIKDLRAFTASVLIDAGASHLQAAQLLRHRNVATTERHYARVIPGSNPHDLARRSVSIDRTLGMQERLDALWEAWVRCFPHVRAKLGLERDDVIAPADRRTGPGDIPDSRLSNDMRSVLRLIKGGAEDSDQEDLGQDLGQGWPR